MTGVWFAVDCRPCGEPQVVAAESTRLDVVDGGLPYLAWTCPRCGRRQWRLLRGRDELRTVAAARTGVSGAAARMLADSLLGRPRSRFRRRLVGR